jgi:endonuclease-8
MPEGPSIVILKELIRELHLEGSLILDIKGNTSIEKERMINKMVISFKSWGKHFLICFEGFTLKIHFLMFGTYLINAEKETPLRLGLKFENDELNFYTCSLKFIEGNIDDEYDWEGDVLSDQWNPRKAESKLREKADALVCDVLLDQDIFAGVGNIIKNEVLYRIGVHPLSIVKDLPANKLEELIKEARVYSFDFLRWKKEYTLKKHWLINTKSTCPLGHHVNRDYLGKTKRRSFFCSECQILYR